MDDSRRTVARALLDIKAIHFYTEKPFVLTSGTESPVYVDCRKLIAYPVQRKTVIAVACETILRGNLARPNTIIAGGETAGIPYAALIAAQLDLPMVYVRKQPKGFGRLAQIEGDLVPGAHVILVEDLMFDAKSKLHFAVILRTAGAEVNDTMIVFDYGNARSRESLHTAKLGLHALTDWDAVLACTEEDDYFNAAQRDVVRDFLRSPSDWNIRRKM